MTLTKTVPRLATKEQATVELPLNRRPPLDTPVHDPVVVNKVAGRAEDRQQPVDVPVAVRSGLGL